MFLKYLKKKITVNRNFIFWVFPPNIVSNCNLHTIFIKVLFNCLSVLFRLYPNAQTEVAAVVYVILGHHGAPIAQQAVNLHGSCGDQSKTNYLYVGSGSSSRRHLNFLLILSKSGEYSSILAWKVTPTIQ